MTLEDIDEQLARASQEARASGDAIAFLMAEHDWLRSALELIRRVIGLTSTELEAIKPHISNLSGRLETHIRKEEEVLFPAIEQQMLEAGHGSTLDMYGEHDAIRIRRDELVAAVAAQTDMRSALAAFSRSILIHFENEEELIFADAPGWLTQEQGLALIARMRALEA